MYEPDAVSTLVLPDAHTFMPILQMRKPGFGEYAVFLPKVRKFSRRAVL